MSPSKTQLLRTAKKITAAQKLAPQEVSYILSFEKKEGEGKAPFVKKAAVPIALLAGFLIAVFPGQTNQLVSYLPWWTNLTPPLLSGADYFWNILSEPVGKANVLYHVPNLVLYAFGILGIKKLFDAIDRKTWVDRVKNAKNLLEASVNNGTICLQLKKGHSVLFIGRGDFIGMQFAVNNSDTVVVVAEVRPAYTNLWNYYSPDSGYEDLKKVVENVCSDKTGEYIFFPVKDDQIFLPGLRAYDLSPHKLDILCQDIRTIERINKWKTKRILIIGDKLHKSFVQSEDEQAVIKGSGDTISLNSIALKYPDVTIIDPTDIVLSHILSISMGRKIVFRATKEGIAEYKKRFYERLKVLGYGKRKLKSGILTIGYDLFEDLTEQQTLSRSINDYLPVVLSKSVRDALIRNGYKKSEFIYVPELVLAALQKKATEQ